MFEVFTSVEIIINCRIPKINKMLIVLSPDFKKLNSDSYTKLADSIKCLKIILNPKTNLLLTSNFFIAFSNSLTDEDKNTCRRIGLELERLLYDKIPENKFTVTFFFTNN
jgi:hypothetical protein